MKYFHLGALVPLSPVSLLAQAKTYPPLPRAADGKPDMTGVWQGGSNRIGTWEEVNATPGGGVVSPLGVTPGGELTSISLANSRRSWSRITGGESTILWRGVCRRGFRAPPPWVCSPCRLFRLLNK